MVIKNLSFVPPSQPKTVLPYIVTLPSDYDPEHDHLPLILFLHGSGECGNDLAAIPNTGLPQLFVNDPDYKGLRVITLSPQCPEGNYWNNFIFGLRDLVLAVAEEFHADPAHISCTGLSMGGFGTWAFAETFPEMLSAIAPICGGGISWLAFRMVSLPVRVFHSERDPSVPVVYSHLMVDELKALGGRAELTVYDSADHNCWDRAYRETDLLSWLMTEK